MDFSCDIALPMSWSRIESARRTVAAGLAGIDEGLRDAAVMVASELAENVVKYGEPMANDESGHVELVIDKSSIVIRSKNGVSPERAALVCALIDKISAAQEPSTLYVTRMRAILTSPQYEGSQLGLYRIVCEGQFRLSHAYAGGLLTITAERSL
jgi:hypothetical protein